MDIDGHQYYTILIGGQEWMAENLRTTRYRNGDPIPNVTDQGAWDGASTGAWCNHLNDAYYDATYGKFYNWYAVANPDICPEGWHVPTDAEWMAMETALGMPGDALEVNGPDRGVAENVGGRMKSTALWNSPNTGASNTSGFSGLPSGLRDTYGFQSLGYGAGWWSASESEPDKAWFRSVFYASAFGAEGVRRGAGDKIRGQCVRCKKD